MTGTARDCEDSSAESNRAGALAEIVLVFLVFFIHGAWQVPEVNEPHYLGKAKHYWDATWAPRDFFLGTADAHEAFYVAFGWLTLWLPLPAVAWCGRIITWALMAIAWRRLSVALVPGALYSVLSAALFVALISRFHMAGEWVIGGVEGKSFAYVFVLFGLASLVRGGWGWALVLFGAAASFHVIVGGWAVVATCIAWLAAANRPPASNLVLPALMGLVLSLGGLLPAIELTWGADPELVDQANRIYVYERLGHHLLPARLPTSYVVRPLLLVGALVPLAWMAPDSESIRRLRGFVAACVGIAALGMAISLLAWWDADLAARLLRYYWFRLSDAMVPLGASLLACAILLRWQRERHPAFAVGLGATMLAAGLHLGDTMWQRRLYPVPPADWRVADLKDWRAVCRWASEETPPDALFLVPRMSQTFRWYSGRGEVVTRKDLPQDAASIVEWHRRLTDIYGPGDTRWPRRTLADLGAARLEELGRKYGADYVVTRPTPPLPLKRVGPLTRTLAVYALPRSPASTSPHADEVTSEGHAAP